MPDQASSVSQEILDLLEDATWAFALVSRRYPLLMQTASEVEGLEQRFPERVQNEGLIQLFRDSFDMLVIDLYSIREGLTGPGGLLNRLRDDPSPLRWRSPDEYGGGHKAALIAGSINVALARLVAPAPATSDAVHALIQRFLAATRPLDEDRNRVRAHRYARNNLNTGHLFIPLPELAGQIDTVARYVADLYLAITGNDSGTDLEFSGGSDGTAADLADLIVHGSINSATLAYGLAPQDETPDDPTPWYWAKRQSALATTGVGRPRSH
jgi:hypothetical protein